MEYLKPEEVAARCRVSRATVYNWIAAGRLKTVRTPGGRIRIVADSRQPIMAAGAR